LRAIRDGNAPEMAAWLRGGTHGLARWETDWSSQTGACQAGLLHGNDHDIPAFRWWEKERNAALVTNHPRDAAELERRHSDGRGPASGGPSDRPMRHRRAGRAAPLQAGGPLRPRTVPGCGLSGPLWDYARAARARHDPASRRVQRGIAVERGASLPRRVGHR